MDRPQEELGSQKLEMLIVRFGSEPHILYGPNQKKVDSRAAYRGQRQLRLK